MTRIIAIFVALVCVSGCATLRRPEVSCNLQFALCMASATARFNESLEACIHKEQFRDIVDCGKEADAAHTAEAAKCRATYTGCLAATKPNANPHSLTAIERAEEFKFRARQLHYPYPKDFLQELVDLHNCRNCLAADNGVVPEKIREAYRAWTVDFLAELANGQYEAP